jgi:hypothetical protein
VFLFPTSPAIAIALGQSGQAAVRVLPVLSSSLMRSARKIFRSD